MLKYTYTNECYECGQYVCMYVCMIAKQTHKKVIAGEVERSKYL